MKKNLVLILLILCSSAFLTSAQVKKKMPSIMVIPSLDLCKRYACVNQVTIYGSIDTVADYAKAVQIEDIKLAIASINESFSTYGFNLVDLGAKLTSLKNSEAQNNARVSKGGETIIMSDLDRLKNSARPDIVIDLSFSIKNTMDQDYYCTFILQALDAYTSKSIAQASGEGVPMMDKRVGLMLKEAVAKYLNNFQTLMVQSFTKMQTDGREVVIQVQRFPSGPEFDTEYESATLGMKDELKIIIEDWINKNAVKGQYNLTDASADLMTFDPVNIPLLDTTRTPPKAFDAYSFTNGLKKFLKNDLSIESTLEQGGIGKSVLIIGAK